MEKVWQGYFDIEGGWVYPSAAYIVPGGRRTLLGSTGEGGTQRFFVGVPDLLLTCVGRSRHVQSICANTIKGEFGKNCLCYPIPLPNVSRRGLTCLGRSPDQLEGATHREVVDLFFQSVFNPLQFPYGLRFQGHRAIRTFPSWAKATKADPAIHTRYQCWNHPKTGYEAWTFSSRVRKRLPLFHRHQQVRHQGIPGIICYVEWCHDKDGYQYRVPEVESHLARMRHRPYSTVWINEEDLRAENPTRQRARARA